MSAYDDLGTFESGMTDQESTTAFHKQERLHQASERHARAEYPEDAPPEWEALAMGEAVKNV